MPHHANGPYLMLTPAGVLQAFAQPQPQPPWLQLQTVLAGRQAPSVEAWAQAAPSHGALLAQGLDAGWLHTVQRNLSPPDVQLDNYLSHVIGGFSGERLAALASDSGFCIGRVGYSAVEAEALCAAAADHAEYLERQRRRGWTRASRFVAFHEDLAMLLPTTSFVPFWVDGAGYCLVLGGEPLINNVALVEMVWGIKSAGSRFQA